MADEQTAARADPAAPNSETDVSPVPNHQNAPAETEETDEGAVGEVAQHETKDNVQADVSSTSQQVVEAVLEHDGSAALDTAQEELSELHLEHATAAVLQVAEQEPDLPNNSIHADADPMDVISIARSALASSVGDDSAFWPPTEGAEADPQKIRAYAKIEFEDGQFYMDTYAVELGRDVRAAKRALQRKLQREFAQRERSRRGSNSSDEMSHQRYAPSSAVSESGGIVNYESTDRKKRRRSRRGSASPTSSSFSRSRQNSMNQPEPFDYQTLAYQSLEREGDEVPSPNDCPLIPVHPPATQEARKTGYGGISRRHARISYNFDRNWFEFEVLGRNGAFVDDQFVDNSQVAVLEHGSRIQIGGVSMTFLLPNQSEAGVDTMSFDFEDGRGESLPVLDTSTSPSSGAHSPPSTPPKSGSELDDDSDESDEDENDENEEDEDEDDGDDEDDELEAGHDVTRRERQRAERKKHLANAKAEKKARSKHRSSGKLQKLKLKVGGDRKGKPKQEGREKPAKPKPRADSQEQLEAPKRDPAAMLLLAEKLGMEVDELPAPRKGPGRPPKDGIMSKREYAQLARQQKERAKAEGVQPGSMKSKPLNGVISSIVGEKRKYTKRKKPEEEDGDGEDIKDSIEGGDGLDGSSAAARAAKGKRPAKPPRSPSPVLEESMFTEEQLQKPPHSYVVLIHEALSNSQTGQLSLPNIYKAIERRYPHYKFRVTTQGWQSSVRHNLSQHSAFVKIEKDGKGWMWGLNPDVPIEKEKKRRPTPPRASTQPYYPPTNPPYRSDQYPYQAAMPSVPNGQPQARPPYPYPPIPPAYGHASSGAGLPAPYGAPALPLAAPVATNNYRSPYAPAPSTETPPSASGAGGESTAQAQHNLYLQNYYKAPRPPATPVGPSATVQQTATPPAAYSPAPQQFQPFVPSVSGVPPDVVESCSKYKKILCESLLPTTPNIEQLIEQALQRAVRAILGCEEVTEQAGEQSADLFVDEVRKMLDTIWNPDDQRAANQNQKNEMSAATQAQSTQAEVDSTANPPPNGAHWADDAAAAEDSTSAQLDAETMQALQAELEAHASAPQPQTESPQLLETDAAESSQAAGTGPGKLRVAAAEKGVGGGMAEPSQVITASKEAVQKVMTSLSAGSKRSHPSEDGEQSPSAINGSSQPDTQPRPKRVAV